MEEKKSSYLRSTFNCPRMEFSPLHMVLKYVKKGNHYEGCKGTNPNLWDLVLIQVKTEQVLLRKDAT